jgi:hypothetical protein
MAMGHPEHVHASPAAPALGHELLAGVDGEAVMPLLGNGPHVAAGPQAFQRPGLLLPASQQQRATLLGIGHLQQGAKSDQEALINTQRSWRGEGHTDTL